VKSVPTMATDIRTSELRQPIDVAEYLFQRLHEVGVRSVHGVPGDYNLVALDYVPKAGLNWVGNVNELNAGIWRLPRITVDAIAQRLSDRLCCGRICESQGNLGHSHNFRCWRAFGRQRTGWCVFGIRAGGAHCRHTFDYLTARWHAPASLFRVSFNPLRGISICN